MFVGQHNFLSCEHPAHKITLRVTLPLLGRIPAIHSTRRQKKNRRLAAVTAAIKLSPWPSTRTQPPRRRWAHQMSAPMVREIPGPCLRQPYATIIWCAYYSYCLCDMLPLRGTWYVPTCLSTCVCNGTYVCRCRTLNNKTLSTHSVQAIRDNTRGEGETSLPSTPAQQSVLLRRGERAVKPTR